MGEKISVVIPAYNASKYIGDMLTSLSKQSYEDFEVILIDDGSTDDTFKVGKKYQDLFGKKLRLVEQKNGGVSKARNLGIDLAIGKFLVFVDADDVVERDFLKKLIEPFSKNSEIDLSIIGYFSEFDNGDLKYKTSGKKVKYSSEEALYNAFILFNYEGYPWNKMYCTKTIKENKLRFNEQIAVCEDLLFFVTYVLKIKKVYYNPTPMYHYILRESSAINGRSLGKRFPMKALSELKAYDLMGQNIPDNLKGVHQILLTRQIWTNSYLSRLIYAAPNKKDSVLIEQYKKMRSFQRKHALFFLKRAKYNFPHKALFMINILCPRVISILDIKRRGAK
ncbi:glycosyltransferase [Lactobacillus fermentum IFO 3956] [Lactiplantibacillus mudanjiangensis]|uniref:glycosyltransferase family A protein n=1 Tax=Lactiplantibacillus mudanjiangensis TaxID=1296538 RepID=UPI001014CECA|nr:glycosyltransferase [Lactobacillus fermentum IFO 3956] [Lactiplantibacillus mudanjiangensis]